MHHFFVDRSQVREGKIIIENSDFNHMKNVLRIRQGEKLRVSDGGNTAYTCELEEYKDHIAVCTILGKEEAYSELPSKIYLFQGLPKGDKLEWIIQKCVELGAVRIVPMRTRRAVVKLDAKKEQARQKRWMGISKSAAKQSGRGMVPKIGPVLDFSQAVREAAELDVCLIPYELAEDMEHTREICSAIRPGQSVGILIGPEGGFEEAEVAEAIEAGAKPITLGQRILRTETAGMALISVLAYLLEGQENFTEQ